MKARFFTDKVEVTAYRESLKGEFERLNREWIDLHFELEPADIQIFEDPLVSVVRPGGQIFFVLENGHPVGTCAVLRKNAERFELAKMAVTSSARGKGYGDLLMNSAIEFARRSQAIELYLLSNRKLVPAIRLYKKFGFRETPVPEDSQYHRVDIVMSLRL